jgi:hypothetical protein
MLVSMSRIVNATINSTSVIPRAEFVPLVILSPAL